MNIINKQELAKFLKLHIRHFSVDEIQKLIEIPPAGINFTYAFPCFRLAKFEKKNPNLIAQDIVSIIDKPEYIEKIENLGPYINIKIKNEITLKTVFQSQENYGKIGDLKTSPKRIVIEYPSPNTNKPLHLGHVRNMLIGSTISNILEYKDNKVFQVNLNNDRGIHICKSMLAYKRWGKNSIPDKKSDHFVGDLYVKYNQEEKNNEGLESEVQEMLRLWEEKDQETRKLWKKLNRWALEGFNKTYEKFGIEFDKQYYESDFYWKGKEKILEGLKKGIFEKREDGTIIAPLKKEKNIPDKVLLRSDGTSIYITQDVYLAFLKKQDFSYDKSIYVVGNEQDLYFKQLFAVLDMIGFKEDKTHLSYGMISLPEGKMKSREGTVVDADEIVEEMKHLAFEEVTKRYPHLSEKEKRYRADIIGMAALRFFILKFSPRSDFIFNPKESIAFEGETGPYIQYSYARIQSIIKKSGEKITPDIEYELLNHEKELELIKELNYFPEIISEVVETYNLHLIPQYLLSLTQSFSSFYTSCPVISDNKKLEKARLFLIKCIQIIIKVGLNLLGIEVLEEM